MDFMVSLPPSRGFNAIMVVVDRFSKMAHFISTKDEATAQKISRLFFTHVFKYHGLPKDIVSDALPSPLLDPKRIQLCQITEVVWDLELLLASSSKTG